MLGEVLLSVAAALLGWRFPFAGLGWMEALFASLLAFLWLRMAFRRRALGWTYLSVFLSLMGVFSWVANTIQSKGGLSYPLALFGTSLFYAYEALGLLAVIAAAAWAHRRTASALATACTAAFLLLLWEIYGFHIYQWGWGPTLAGLPWMARSAAFLTTYGMSALVWGAAAASASLLASGRPRLHALFPPALALAFLALLSGLWHLLPRGPERILDVVMIQPNFPSGARLPGMEREMWARSDRVLQGRFPRPGVATLLLWPESSVLSVNQLGPDPRLAEEARRRGVAWLFGTEGGEPGGRFLLYNLVRGEDGGGPSFVQAKHIPMPFGERMPGPGGMRRWLDEKLGFISQEPGQLSSGSSFRMSTPQGPLVVHPLICSEALIATRVQEGVALTGAELLTNHTNDGWFDRSVATDLHGVQIRLRAVEMGLPLLRSTLTGKSGIFREDGTWALWGEPMSAAEHAFTLRWRPIRTPARSPWTRHGLLALLGLGTLLSLVRRKEAQRERP
jgi:apolipoprotein N-acyltransferase